ncbi:MAG: baseplate J/gp47 family protein [Lachnospiraceae bacterium]|nr:baseplate J/gp47 family protein [Lachnospiraceae bacterium]
MYEEVTYDVILQRMLDRVSSKFDKREGSVIWDTHSPTAIELQILYLELDNILLEMFGDTASREYLIKLCAEKGIIPDEATYAILQGEFTPSGLDLTGQRFNIDDLNFVVLDLISEDGTTSYYQVQCETAGIVGNQYLGTMVPIDYIDGLETAELIAVLIPGEDEQDTEDLREEYLSSFNNVAFAGNVAAYKSIVNDIAGVGGVKVKRVWNSDISPTDMIPSDAVQEWYASVIDTLDEEPAAWLEAVYTAALEKKLVTGGTVLVTIINSTYGAASDTLVETVQEELDPTDSAGEGYGLAPIGHVVTVQSVEEVELNITVTISYESGYSWSNLSNAITDAVKDYLEELCEDWAVSDSLTVRISQIEARILAVTGVVDVADTAINGDENNLTLDEYEIPVLGGINS